MNTISPSLSGHNKKDARLTERRRSTATILLLFTRVLRNPCVGYDRPSLYRHGTNDPQTVLPWCPTTVKNLQYCSKFSKFEIRKTQRKLEILLRCPESTSNPDMRASGFVSGDNRSLRWVIVSLVRSRKTSLTSKRFLHVEVYDPHKFRPVRLCSVLRRDKKSLTAERVVAN